jgi:hypothetical protein
LESYDLSVGELASVVHQGHGSYGRADVARAAGWFFDFAAVDLDLDGV